MDTDDEIGALSRSFDKMAAAVESRIAALDENVRRQKDFVAAFTHEIKTPMTGMLGYADLMRARPKAPRPSGRPRAISSARPAAWRS